MLEFIISSTIAGTSVCILILIFKNRILELLGGRILYIICLLSMLLFVLPLNMLKFPAVMEKIVYSGNTEQMEPGSVNITVATDVVYKTEEQIDGNISLQEPEPHKLPSVSSVVRRENPITLYEIFFAVWLSGLIVALIRYFVSYFLFKKRICGAGVSGKLNGVKLIKSPIISSPIIFGFFSPTLAIPEMEIDEEDYRLAIQHEMTHYKHRDSWLKLYAVLVNSVCWFNPVTYFMLNLIGEACEYACDEQVTRNMDKEEKRQYSEMILAMVCQKSTSLSSNMAKSKKQLKRRFEMIMKTRNKRIMATIISLTTVTAIVCGSVAVANTAAPLVSALLSDDFVYVSTNGINGYSEMIPVKKDGEYYLPFREFLNKSDVENDKIKYNNGEITVDLWTKEIRMYSIGVSEGETESVTEEQETFDVIPSKYSWSTSCKIGSKEIEIAGEKYTLDNAPYLEDGITYVPYEYLKKLKLYEDKAAVLFQPRKNRLERTSKFNSLMMFGYKSANAEYYTDYIHMEKIVGESSFSSMTYNADAKISKTGYRTEFEASYNYFDWEDVNKEGSVKIKLNEVTRIYSKGSDLEGLFTVEIDGKTVYENKKGNITQLPIPAGEGVLAIPTTRIKIGELKIDVWFTGFNNISEEYDTRGREVGKMSELLDTVRKFIVPSEVKLNGRTVARGSKMYSYLWYNEEKKLIDTNIQFDTFDGTNGEEMEFYRVHAEVDSKLTVIDENTILAELYFTEGNNIRIDSFDAIITFLPDEKFELKSTDGKYIIRGVAQKFVPQWEWSDEQKNAPVPQVVMIDE